MLMCCSLVLQQSSLNSHVLHNTPNARLGQQYNSLRAILVRVLITMSVCCSDGARVLLRGARPVRESVGRALQERSGRGDPPKTPWLDQPILVL